MKRALTAFVLALATASAGAFYDGCDDPPQPTGPEVNVSRLFKMSSDTWHPRTFVLLGGAQVCAPWLHQGPRQVDETFAVHVNCRQLMTDVLNGDQTRAEWSGPNETVWVRDVPEGCVLRKFSPFKSTRILLSVPCGEFAQNVLDAYPN